VLQHRGQDAAGIVTANGNSFHMHKGSGMVRDVFRTRNMRSLLGKAGIGHVRYPTAGSASSLAEAQPFYVNSPFGIVLAHNGNLTNTEALKRSVFEKDLRHINTQSDSEVLLNVFAHELEHYIEGTQLSVEAIFKGVAGVHRRAKGAYAVVALIAGHGLVAFRDPCGIRPLVLGRNEFAVCLPDNSSLSYAILRGLVARLRNADRQIESLALLDVYGRVARALLDMAEDEEGRRVIRSKVSRQDLAKVVGASREMVSRVMKDLEERGLIETQENGWVVLTERLATQ